MEQAVRNFCPAAKAGSSLYVLENGRQDLQDLVHEWLEETLPEE